MDTLIYVPAAVALLIKFLIVLFAKKELLKSAITRTFLLLIVVLTIANCLELLSFYYGSAPPGAAEALIKIYYASLAFSIAFLLQISLFLVDTSTVRWATVLCNSIALVMSLFILFTDAIITDVRSISYTITRVPGEYYFVAPAYAVTMLVSSIGASVYGYRRATLHYNRIQSMYVLLSVFSLALPIFIAIVFMGFGFETNASIIFPIGVSMFLLTLTYGLNAEGLYDIRAWIPGTLMFQLHRSVHKEFMLNLDGTEMTAKERIQAHERRFILQALIQADGNQKKAAQLLQVSEATISLKRKKYNI